MSRCFNCMNEVSGRFCPHCGCDMENYPQNGDAIIAGTVLRDRYLIGKVLGQGGFGITYMGYDQTLMIKVAVKEYYPRGIVTRSLENHTSIHWPDSTDQETRENGKSSFLREAQRMAKIDNIPASVRVRDTFQDNDTAYIVMDFIEGQTLKDRLMEKGVMTMPQLLDILGPIMEGMDKAHRQGIVHRDISPDNIMIQPDGEAKLLDLGAAKDLTVESKASMAVAKNGFSPLEQYTENGRIGSWTDVYAMAATIYYCITGQLVPSALERVTGDNTNWNYPAIMALTDNQRSALFAGLAVQIDQRVQTMQDLLNRLKGGSASATPIQGYQATSAVTGMPIGATYYQNSQNQAGFAPTGAYGASYQNGYTQPGSGYVQPGVSAPYTQYQQPQKKKGMPVGGIIGIAAGVIVLAVVAILFATKPWAGSTIDDGEKISDSKDKDSDKEDGKDSDKDTDKDNGGKEDGKDSGNGGASDPEPAKDTVSIVQYGARNGNLLGLSCFNQISKTYDYFIGDDLGLNVVKYNNTDSVFYIDTGDVIAEGAYLILIGQEHIYYASSNTTSGYVIQQANLDGSSVSTLFTVSSYPKNLQYVLLSDGSEYLYYEQTNSNGVYDILRYNLSTGNIETILDGDYNWFNLYKDSMYYIKYNSSDLAATKVYKSDLNGENEEILIDSDSALAFGFVEDDYIVLYSYNQNALMIYDMDGSAHSERSGLYDFELNSSLTIAYEEGWVYYIETDGDIYRDRLASSSKEYLTNIEGAYLINVTNNNIYVASETMNDYEYVDYCWFMYKDGTSLIEQGNGGHHGYNFETAAESDFTYTTSGSGVTITGYNGSLTTFAVPETIDGKPVVEIGENAFYYSDIVGIGLPDTVVTIGSHAFESCYDLEYVGLQPGLEKIDDHAFYFCTSLDSIYIPEGVTSIMGYCFAYCNFTEVTLPGSVNDIGVGIFASNFSLQNIYVGDGSEDFVSVDGVLYCVWNADGFYFNGVSGDCGLLVCYPAGRDDSYYYVDSECWGIWYNAFEGNYYLDEVYCYDSFAYIYEDAFTYTIIQDVSVPATCTVEDNSKGTVSYR